VTPFDSTVTWDDSLPPISSWCSQLAEIVMWMTSPGEPSLRASVSSCAARGVTVTVGALAGATRSPSFFSRSPDSNIWRTMSAPPTNSPLMNSCGNVGQSEYSFMPPRTSGSERTLTVAYLGIKVFRMFTTDAENPHCGKLRVPFMNRTTGSWATSESIFCLICGSSVMGIPGGY